MTSIRLYRSGWPRRRHAATLTLARAASGIVLHSVESRDRRLAARIAQLLGRPSIRVVGATASASDGLRTRGESVREEPYGTPAYWHAALERLEYDLDVEVSPADRDAFIASLPPSWTRLTLEPAALRRDLTRFAEWQRHGDPHALADEVVARGLRDMGVLPEGEQRRMLYQVARNLVRAGWQAPVASPARSGTRGAAAAMARLTDADRADLLRYYGEPADAFRSPELSGRVRRIREALREDERHRDPVAK